MNTCLECGKPLEAKRSSKKYCSSACKQMAYLKRNSVKRDDNITIYNNPVTLNEKKAFTGSDGNNTPYHNPVTITDDKQSFYDMMREVLHADDDQKTEPFTLSAGKPDVKTNHLLPVLYPKSENTAQPVTASDDNYQWIVPELFTKLEQQMKQNGNRHYFRRNGKEYFTQKLSTNWKSILHEVLRLSYQISTSSDEFTRLYNAMIGLEDSTEFRCCTDYPYKDRITQLISKWSQLLDEAEEDASFTITASLKQTALQMLCEIGDTVMHIPFDTRFKHLYEEEEEEEEEE